MQSPDKGRFTVSKVGTRMHDVHTGEIFLHNGQGFVTPGEWHNPELQTEQGLTTAEKALGLGVIALITIGTGLVVADNLNGHNNAQTVYAADLSSPDHTISLANLHFQSVGTDLGCDVPQTERGPLAPGTVVLASVGSTHPNTFGKITAGPEANPDPNNQVCIFTADLTGIDNPAIVHKGAKLGGENFTTVDGITVWVRAFEKGQWIRKFQAVLTGEQRAENGKTFVKLKDTKGNPIGEVGLEAVSPLPLPATPSTGKGGGETLPNVNVQPSAGIETVSRYVAQGDTLSYLAALYETTEEAIKRDNNLKSDVIHPGQELKIKTTIIYKMRNGDTFVDIAKRNNIPIALLAIMNGISYDEGRGLSNLNYNWKTGAEVWLPKTTDELTLSKYVSLVAGNEWSNAQKALINKAGPQIVNIVDQTRVLNGVYRREKVEIPVHYITPEREAELQKANDIRMGEFVGKDPNDPSRPWGVFIRQRDKVGEKADGWQGIIGHELAHWFVYGEPIAWAAGMRVNQYNSWPDQYK